MIDLLRQVYGENDDPEQVVIGDEERNKLMALHPGARTELRNENGPYSWILLVPTTSDLMYQFLNGTINENQLFHQTEVGIKYDALYLCSALILPEFRRKGLVKNAAINAISSILEDHSIKYLFYWPFSEEGTKLAESLANKFNLPLLRKNR